MSSTKVIESDDIDKSDDTLIIIVNSDGTLTVDPHTLEKVLANQSRATVSVIRIDGPEEPDSQAENVNNKIRNGTADRGAEGSRVNLTVEGFYPPLPISQSSILPLVSNELFTSNNKSDNQTPFSSSCSVEADATISSTVSTPLSYYSPSNDSVTCVAPSENSGSSHHLAPESYSSTLIDGILKPNNKEIEDNQSIELNSNVHFDHCYTVLYKNVDEDGNILKTSEEEDEDSFEIETVAVPGSLDDYSDNENNLNTDDKNAALPQQHTEVLYPTTDNSFQERKIRYAASNLDKLTISENTGLRNTVDPNKRNEESNLVTFKRIEPRRRGGRPKSIIQDGTVIRGRRLISRGGRLVQTKLKFDRRSSFQLNEYSNKDEGITESINKDNELPRFSSTSNEVLPNVSNDCTSLSNSCSAVNENTYQQIDKSKTDAVNVNISKSDSFINGVNKAAVDEDVKKENKPVIVKICRSNKGKKPGSLHAESSIKSAIIRSSRIMGSKSIQQNAKPEFIIKQENEIKTPIISTRISDKPMYKQQISNRRLIGRRMNENDESNNSTDDEDDNGLRNSVKSGGVMQETEDDPNKLWCICNKPHNNRFMICCDSCDNWFHGYCVGISKAMGEKMEQNGTEWLCPPCRRQKTLKEREVKQKLITRSSSIALKEPVSKPRSLSESVSSSSDISNLPTEDSTLEDSILSSSSCSPATAINNKSVTSSNDVESNSEKIKQTTLTEFSSSSAISKVVCVVCKNNVMKPDSIYCSEACIELYVNESLRVFRQDKPIDDHENLIVCERKSGRLLSGSNSPTVGNIKSWLLQHPTFEIMKPRLNSSSVNPRPLEKLASTRSAAVLDSSKLMIKRRRQSSISKHFLSKNTVEQATPKVGRLLIRAPRSRSAEKEDAAKDNNVSQNNRVKQPTQSGLNNELKLSSPVKLPATIEKDDHNSTAASKEKSGNSSDDGRTTITSTSNAIDSTAGSTGKATPPTRKITMIKNKMSFAEALNSGNCSKPDEIKTKKVARHVMLIPIQPAPPKLNQQVQPKSNKQNAEQNFKSNSQSALQSTRIKGSSDGEKSNRSQSAMKKSDKKTESNNDDVPKTPKDEPVTDSKKSKVAPQQLDPIRANVRKSLCELLTSRLKETSEVVLNDEEVVKLANEIEEELHNLFKDTGMKYKSKYRSLLFNIKDKKNTLFLKIAQKSINSYDLVRLTPEELASQELAQWRQREAKHEIDMIKKSELELLQQAKTYVVKTHKGEQEIETDDKVSKPSDISVPDLNEFDDTVEDRRDTLKKKSSSNYYYNKDKGKFLPLNNDPQQLQQQHEDSKKDDSSSSKSKKHHHSDRHHRRHHHHHHNEHDDKHHRRHDRKHRKHSKRRSSERDKSTDGKRRHHSDGGNHSDSDDQSSSKRHKKSEDDLKMSDTDRSNGAINGLELSSREDFGKQSANSDGLINETSRSFGSFELEDGSTTPVWKDSSINDSPLEVESSLDMEPSSTVMITTPPYISSSTEKSTLWKGYVMMPDVAQFYASIKEVSGNCDGLEDDLSDTIECVGRISPNIVWDYIAKIKKSGSKEILIFQFDVDELDQKVDYLGFYSYLNNKNRMAVVGNASPSIKDFYVFPLPNHSPIPQVLLPINGPGFGDFRPHLLLGIVVRMRRSTSLDSFHSVSSKASKKQPFSSYSLAPPGEESYTPPHSPTYGTMNELSNETDSNSPYTPDDDVEEAPYSPSALLPDEIVNNDPSADLEKQMEELNRKIEEEKRLISDMSSSIINTENVPSSHSYKSPENTNDDDAIMDDIKLPSNIQLILNSIRKRTSESTPMVDPIVSSYKENIIDAKKIILDDENVEDVAFATTAASSKLISDNTPDTSTVTEKINRDPRRRQTTTATSNVCSDSAANTNNLIMSSEPPPPGVDDDYINVAAVAGAAATVNIDGSLPTSVFQTVIGAPGTTDLLYSSSTGVLTPDVNYYANYASMQQFATMATPAQLYIPPPAIFTQPPPPIPSYAPPPSILTGENPGFSQTSVLSQPPPLLSSAQPSGSTATSIAPPPSILPSIPPILGVQSISDIPTPPMPAQQQPQSAPSATNLLNQVASSTTTAIDSVLPSAVAQTTADADDRIGQQEIDKLFIGDQSSLVPPGTNDLSSLVPLAVTATVSSKFPASASTVDIKKSTSTGSKRSVSRSSSEESDSDEYDSDRKTSKKKSSRYEGGSSRSEKYQNKSQRYFNKDGRYRSHQNNSGKYHSKSNRFNRSHQQHHHGGGHRGSARGGSSGRGYWRGYSRLNGNNSRQQQQQNRANWNSATHERRGSGSVRDEWDKEIRNYEIEQRQRTEHFKKSDSHKYNR